MKKVVLSASMIALVFAYSCGGGEKTPPAADTQAGQPAAPAPTADVKPLPDGKTIYDNTCKACHQENGEGIAKTFPPLAKSDYLANVDAVIDQVIKGKTGEMVVNGETYNNAMPAQPLNDEEIAAVLTYVYSSWGNTGAAVTVDQVKAIRGK